MNNQQRTNLLTLCDALESGRYAQGKNRLRSPNNKFCCLGVAADLIDSNKWIYDSSYLWPDNDVTYGCLSQIGSDHYGISVDQQIDLVQLNDSGKSFLEIAQYIRKNILGEENATESIECTGK